MATHDIPDVIQLLPGALAVQQTQKLHAQGPVGGEVGVGRGARGCQLHCAPSLEAWRDLTRSAPREEVPNSPHGRKV